MTFHLYTFSRFNRGYNYVHVAKAHIMQHSCHEKYIQIIKYDCMLPITSHPGELITSENVCPRDVCKTASVSDSI